MKHFLILLFSIIVGKWTNFPFALWKIFFFVIAENVFSVFSLYRSLSADETDRNDNEVDYVYNNLKGGNKMELQASNQKIKQLELRIAELEDRLPKKYDEVKFLNYQNRKRILVKIFCNLWLNWK